MEQEQDYSEAVQISQQIAAGIEGVEDWAELSRELDVALIKQVIDGRAFFAGKVAELLEGLGKVLQGEGGFKELSELHNNVVRECSALLGLELPLENQLSD